MNKCEIRAAEKPLKNFTKMALEGKNLHYWKRLELFRLFSNQRRMERYKIFYIWKSLNGHVPNIGLKWQTRDCSKLTYPKTFGSKGRARTLQKNALNWEGVKLFNSLPKYIRTWKGTPLSFKDTLDKFLQLIPDQPDVTGDKPGGRTVTGDCSNSVTDWLRVLKLNDDDCKDDEDKTTIPTGESDDSINLNIVCTSIMGSGLNPDHS